ncbi:MAG: phosphatidylglycerophosphatase A [Acidobacteriaceae bacterium]|jgi:phosphatidylglycerophosphatase A|nr:phosphatidylglycerophosphatase A [Acidobacteriaceae bacterium]
MRPIALALATSFGVGYVPVAPGTFGSAVGLLLWWFLPHDIAWQTAASLVLFAAGTWSASIAETHFGSTDPSAVVVDEVMGMLVTLVGLPVGWMGALLAFFLFRLFDIIKPWPANRFEALHGGFGIMADDFMAGVYGNLAARLILWLTAGLVAW